MPSDRLYTTLCTLLSDLTLTGYGVLNELMSNELLKIDVRCLTTLYTTDTVDGHDDKSNVFRAGL